MMASPLFNFRVNDDPSLVRGTKDDYIMTQIERQVRLLQQAVQVFTQT